MTIIIKSLLHHPLVCIKSLGPQYQPCVPQYSVFHLHVHHCLINSHCIIQPCRSVCRVMNDALRNHPRCPQPPKVILERLIKANVNGLAKGGASSCDVLDLHPKLLDLLNY